MQHSDLWSPYLLHAVSKLEEVCNRYIIILLYVVSPARVWWQLTLHLFTVHVMNIHILCFQQASALWALWPLRGVDYLWAVCTVKRVADVPPL